MLPPESIPAPPAPPPVSTPGPVTRQAPSGQCTRDQPPVIVWPSSFSSARLPTDTPGSEVGQTRSAVKIPVPPAGTSCPHVPIRVCPIARAGTNGMASEAHRIATVPSGPKVVRLLMAPSKGGASIRATGPAYRLRDFEGKDLPRSLASDLDADEIVS